MPVPKPINPALIRKRETYKRFERLAGLMGKASVADVLRAFHQELSDMRAYGSCKNDNFAFESLCQIIADHHLDQVKPMALSDQVETAKQP